ncbi:MAG: hypothetical protein Q8O98_02470, partial [bacterium]|nr:hypothetical protein [bacterium]
EPEELALLWASREAFSVIVHKITDNILNVRKNSKLGLGVEIHIPLDDITGDVSKVDFLHLMSISEMGAQGRPFEPKIFDRIREVKEKFPDMSISVDGGINKDNFEELGKAGVSKAIVGSAFEELWQSLQMKK